MTTDFNYDNKIINSSGPIKPSGKDQPGDPRTRVELYSDIELIPNPYIGMIVTVKADETNQNKMTDYKVISLKANALGIANSVIDQVQRYANYLGVSTGSGAGLTSEQEAKLNSIDNKVDKIYGKGLSTEDFTTEEKTTLANLKTTVGDKSGLPSGDANVIASINRIDGKTTTGNGLTTEQEQQLQTAYEHSQTTHVQASDIPSLNGYATETFVTSKIAEAQLGGGEVDLSAYATKTYADNAVSTALDGHTFKFLTQSEYDALPTKDPLVEYRITDAVETTITKVSQLENDSNFATTSYVDNAITTIQVSSGGNPWEGKVASFIGDSITYGARTTKQYHAYLKDIFKFSTVNNYGVDGSTITNRRSGMCGRYNTIDSNSDIIFIFGGTNDFGLSIGLGEWYTTASDGKRTLTTNVSTLRGALNVLCNGLITMFPDKQIILLTPIHRSTFGNTYREDQKNQVGLYLEDYVECIKEAGRNFSIPVIDLWNESGLFPMNEANAEIYFTPSHPDLLHPNANGHQRIAFTIAKHLKNMYPFSSSSSTTPKNYSITNNLSNVTTSNSVTSISSGSSYSTTLTANSGYTLSSVTVTMGGSDITSTSYSNGTVTITKVTGNIIITATATSSSTTPTTYTITNTLTNVTTNNSAKTITEGSSYSATLTPTDGYEITSVTVSMGAADVTSTAYSNGNININSVVGNLTIIATATQTSSGTDAPGGYRRLALSDLSIIGDRISGLAINENNEVTVESAAQWDGILVNESIQEMKFTTRATVTSFGDLLWLIYSNNGDGTYNATTLGNSNSKGRKYKFTLPSISASSIGADNFSVSAGSTVTATISGGNLIIKDGNNTTLVTISGANQFGFVLQQTKDSPICSNVYVK